MTENIFERYAHRFEIQLSLLLQSFYLKQEPVFVLELKENLLSNDHYFFLFLFVRI